MCTCVTLVRIIWRGGLEVRHTFHYAVHPREVENVEQPWPPQPLPLLRPKCNYNCSAGIEVVYMCSLLFSRNCSCIQDALWLNLVEMPLTFLQCAGKGHF